MAAGERNPTWEGNFAWLIASDPKSTADDLQKAISAARDATVATHQKQPLALDALAAALARASRFDDAIAAAQQAIDAANAAHDPALAKAIETRMMLYRAGEPYIAAK